MAAPGSPTIEPRTRVRLCGRLTLEIDGRETLADLPEGQGRSLLTYLLAHRHGGTDRDALVDIVWPSGAPDNAKAYLRVILSRLRRDLAPAELGGRERLSVTLPEPVWVDVDEASRAVEAARAAAGEGAWRSTLDEARVAVELLRPGFAPGIDGGWAQDRRAEVEELQLEALEWAARSGLELGGAELPAAQHAAGELVSRSPFRESGYRLLMETLAASGNVAEALQAYDELRVLLRDELGAVPAPEVQALHQRLLGGEPHSPQPAAPTATPPARVPLPALLSPREGGAFVGRESELTSLRQAWADARSGARRLVVLAGEPGIGKSRLASELAREAHADGTVLYAGCQEDALVSYQPFVEALRHYAREGAAIPLGPGGGELARLIPELAPHVADGGDHVADDPETRRYLMFEAVSTLLTEAAHRGPVLLVLDDLHWADRPTLQLLRHVVRAQNQAALLILGSYRESEVTPEHPLFELLADLRRDRLFERVSLGGLDRTSVGSLIESQAGHTAPSALVQTVHEETEGNPFFVEEVMRHLIESGVVFERDGRWTSELTVGEIGVPEGVKEVLVRRLARLSDGCRAVLSQAAVLGREFPFDLLPAMSGAGEDEVIGALEEALDAQLVVEAREGAGSVYVFTHALVRETLYGGLSAPRRQRTHAQAAAAIEASGAADSDARVAALAMHYRLAADPANGIGYCLRAGERARQLFAWEDAVAHWHGALELMELAGTDRAERARLLVAVADVAAVVDDLARQIGYLGRALALYAELGDDELTAQVHSRLGMAHSLMDTIYAEHLDLRRAFRHFDAARTVLDRGPVRKARGHLETGVATALTYGVRTEQGLQAGARAMEIAEELGDEALWAGAAQAYGWHMVVSGKPTEGFEMVERGFQAADRGQRPFLAWMGSNIRGQMMWGIGDPDSAEPFFQRLLDLRYAGKTAYHQELADGVGRCHASRGEMDSARRLLSDARPAWITHSLQPLVDLWDGNWDRVDALARRVLETSRRTGNRWDEWASNQLAARVHSLRGETQAAADSLERARRIVDEGGARYFEMWVLPDLARALAELGELDDARRHVERGREIMAADNWRGRRGIADVADAVVLSFEGRPDEAGIRFGEALATLRQFRLRADEADALHQWGLALSRAGDGSGAAEKLDEAASVYREYGAGAAWLERVTAPAGRH